MDTRFGKSFGTFPVLTWGESPCNGLSIGKEMREKAKQIRHIAVKRSEVFSGG